MKKLMALTLSMLALIALVVAPATSFAGSCSGHAKTTDAKLGAAQCSTKDAAACAEKLGLSVEECKTLCAVEGHEFVSLSIEGMTCTGCENSITTALEAIPGVMKVGKVSHTDGSAFVIIDSKQVEAGVLAKAVTKKGYKSEVVLASAETKATNATAVSAKAAGCGTMTKKACSKTCAKTCASTAKTETKTDKTEGTE